MWPRVKSKGRDMGEEQSQLGLLRRGGLRKATALTSSDKTRRDNEERLAAGSSRTPDG